MNPNKEPSLWLEEQPRYDESQRTCIHIEHRFGAGQIHHGLAVSLPDSDALAIQAHFTAIALNLRQLVRGLTGVSP